MNKNTTELNLTISPDIVNIGKTSRKITAISTLTALNTENNTLVNVEENGNVENNTAPNVEDDIVVENNTAFNIEGDIDVENNTSLDVEDDVENNTESNAENKKKTQSPMDEFEEMNLKENILRGLFKYGFTKPSAIQSKAIPLVLLKRDLIAQSQSGTGKTGAFVISTLERINENINGCQSIVISPTRELSQQIYNVFTAIGHYTKIKFDLCVGGTRVQDSRNKLRNGVHIVIGTPGRIIDMIERRFLNTRTVRLLVFDEADELLKGTFIEQIKNIINSIPNNAQICLFSATMPERELELTKNFLNDPIMVLVDKEKLSLKEIKQFYINVEKECWKLDTLCDIYGSISINQAMIYVNTKEKAIQLSKNLTEKNFTVSVFHSQMQPSERLEVMKKFRNGVTRILVSTDLLARGIDIEQVSIVVNYDLPRNVEHYLHRIGRSGRFGRKGVAINFIAYDDINMLKYLEKHYDISIGEMPEEIACFL
jgi:translation initiation factor 4A